MDNKHQQTGLVKKLLASQRFAVLATQSEGQPYSNPVAFADTDDLISLVFVTNRNTRKYSNTLEFIKNEPRGFTTLQEVRVLNEQSSKEYNQLHLQDDRRG